MNKNNKKKEQEQELKIQIVTKSEQIEKIINNENLVLFNVNGWNALLPKSFLESFLHAQKTIPLLQEYEEFNSWLLLEKNISVDELKVEFLRKLTKESLKK